ncbi:hypothetical protein [Hymenobacter psychrophilus]|uniref:Uncharacterized protein n=1 Tax=Hymenobacter psychrophilus TaxID=651662 RepID=A0A1H3M7J7_9BACT|nr:hypothetical protein [Hymenobacter psychrophilus]SDY72691.1 hypothetical protein SAMN04488069_11287 [Hymenobacter psychrophilus]
MQYVPAVSHHQPTAPAPHHLPATEADFHDWLQDLLPSVRAALARQGFEKTSKLSAFQQFLQERANGSDR